MFAEAWRAVKECRLSFERGLVLPVACNDVLHIEQEQFVRGSPVFIFS